MNLGVTSLRTLLGVWLAILWLPTSSHVLLEQAGVIHTHHPHAHESSDAGHAESPSGHSHESHDAADGRCTRALVDGTPLLMVPDLMPAVLAGLLGLGLPALDHVPAARVPEAPGTAPPELAPTWQFLLRTTPRVRAPSPVA